MNWKRVTGGVGCALLLSVSVLGCAEDDDTEATPTTLPPATATEPGSDQSGVVMPDYEGTSLRDARIGLEQLGLNLDRVSTIRSWDEVDEERLDADQMSEEEAAQAFDSMVTDGGDDNGIVAFTLPEPQETVPPGSDVWVILEPR
ncbi:hypothetical protein DW322_14180 [Rhodococcus rhodnii]|uniref:PASTA domain-containing protein n=2 Tax=Rhodococcus rhodnii TaxID=38312 RepID=R7WIM9_9NOCA|nr:PASTA domain-containing protein [Rhodococcus rhodnii]EOM75058.1 hypothetical protein Rrhod_3671 [Rhodococcus rhodnii LMG 5362]TXG91155.1 hypothetical protein DW322_14180 [Rhodococcus rhodnii]